MRTALSLGLAAALASAAPALAEQPADPHAGHQMPGMAMPAPPAPAAPAAPATAPEPHAGHRMAGMTMPAPPEANAAPPPVPTDHDADRYYPAAAMNAARARLQQEHGRLRWSQVLFEKLEVRPSSDTGYAWEGLASFGGDIDRLVIKSRGEGARRLDHAEAEILWDHALSPWFNLETGVRRDFQGHGRTYATVGVDGLAPYEFHVNGALFLSERGGLSARLEGAHDYRLTQRLIAEPRAEVNLAAQDDRRAGVGSGLTSVELGLRLRYAIAPEFAPYVGVEHQREFGRTARLTRAEGGDPNDTRLVVGLRTWF